MLSPDKSEWPSMVIQALFNAHPYLVFDDAKIVINDLEQEREVRDGVISIMVGGRVFQIPFVIKRGQLYPMDFFFDLETHDIYVLNKENFFKAIYATNNLGTPQEEQPQTPSVNINVTENVPQDPFTQVDRLALLNDSYGKVKVGMVQPVGRLRKVVIYEV